MTGEYTGLSASAAEDTAQKAAALFCDEIERRTGIRPEMKSKADEPCIAFCVDGNLTDKDSFRIFTMDRTIVLTASGIRGLIYAYSMFLRKTEYRDGRIVLVEPIDGDYAPDKTIRGHQLGYRTISNTYDAWTPAQYRRYYLDMMAFGSNTVEHIPARGDGSTNVLMQSDADEMCVQGSAIADEFDLDVSLWIPNDSLPIAESTSVRREIFERCPRLNVVFPPGGDPGDYPADAFLQRVTSISRALKEVKPHAQMWPSAQAPHSVPDWGEAFMTEMQRRPVEIDGIITGPNRAFPIDELRRRLPIDYPIRLYPDITHNVRCEYPVHALHDDWHYALASTLSRECINPRPQEYRLIHTLTRRYVVGSVSYSEGVNDDVNKMVWADMDFDPNRPLYESLLDYARLFIWQAPAAKIADGILALEMNWIGDPAENPHIEATYTLFHTLETDIPHLLDNWRFCQLLFRSICDLYVRRRRAFDLQLLKAARCEMRRMRLERAETILHTEYPRDVTDLRIRLDDLAQRLFYLIGMQLDVSRFGASHWERGATLETIDLPVTDKAFYLNRLDYAKALPADRIDSFIIGLLDRNLISGDRYYYSFAEHGLDAPGEAQTPDFYMDFQGDRPNVNNGTIPMAQLKLFDHFSFRCKLSGFTNGDYMLRVSYSSRKTDSVTAHRVSLDGRTLYCGKQYGGEKNPQFDRDYLAPGTETATYRIPADYFTNGCAELVIEEPTVGVMLSEFWILPA